jgi:hypothetical protein
VFTVLELNGAIQYLGGWSLDLINAGFIFLTAASAFILTVLCFQQDVLSDFIVRMLYDSSSDLSDSSNMEEPEEPSIGTLAIT